MLGIRTIETNSSLNWYAIHLVDCKILILSIMKFTLQ